MNSVLLTQLKINEKLSVKNRVVMSAMTRNFADKDHKANDLIKNYYAKRAKEGIGLILTEGVVIHQSADGYNDVPHIQTEEQAKSWIPTIEAVHAEGGKIVCQLWHCGRISHEDYTGGIPPVSSTDVAAEGINRQNGKPYGKPIALDKNGMKEIQQYYINSSKLALEVGFDAVQLHLGHGYLTDSFFDARINTRTDEYGGSVENRCRFAVELVEKVLEEIDADKVIIRVSPSRDMGGIYDWPDLEEMVAYFFAKMWEIGIRTIDISCARADYYETSGRIIRMVRPHWNGIIMGGASLTQEQAEKEIETGLLDMVTWGRATISNPDIVKKIENNQEFTEFSVDMLKSLV